MKLINAATAALGAAEQHRFTICQSKKKHSSQTKAEMLKGRVVSTAARR